MTFLRTGAMRALMLLAALVTMGATEAPRVTYTLTPVLDAGAMRAIDIEIEFRGAGNGQTVLDLPDAWGGEEQFYRSVQDLTVTGASLREGASAAQRVLVHRPNARVRVRYRLIQDWQGEPSAGESRNNYRAVVQPGYFQFIGYAALAVPELDEESPVSLRTRLPRGWSFASDLQHGGLMLVDVQRSISVGGDYRVVRTSDPNVRVAIRGQWSFTDEAIATETFQIVNAQRRFWGDASTPYLVTVTQLSAPSPDWRSVGGTGLGDAFAFFATPNAERATITRVLAHEGLHSWIPDQLGGMSPDEMVERSTYWFSEGFTDFYTARLLVRDRVWSPQEYAADLNAMLSAYARSPVRTEPNARIAADFWTDSNVRQLPYQRGRVLALMWDARLRAAGARDMDDLVMAMRQRHRADAAPTADVLFPLAAADVGLSLGGDLDRYVTRGEMVLLPENALAPCGRIVTRDVPNFHRGFDIDATQANNMVIAGVVRTGPAYAAGMRDGMTLIRRTAGEVGDATQPITYLVRDGGTERSLTYVPRATGSFSEQRLELASPLEGETLAQCVRVLGGD